MRLGDALPAHSDPGEDFPDAPRPALFDRIFPWSKPKPGDEWHHSQEPTINRRSPPPDGGLSFEEMCPQQPGSTGFIVKPPHGAETE
jgi:hypothetical protein